MQQVQENLTDKYSDLKNERSTRASYITWLDRLYNARLPRNINKLAKNRKWLVDNIEWISSVSSLCEGALKIQRKHWVSVNFVNEQKQQCETKTHQYNILEQNCTMEKFSASHCLCSPIIRACTVRDFTYMYMYTTVCYDDWNTIMLLSQSLHVNGKFSF